MLVLCMVARDQIVFPKEKLNELDLIGLTGSTTFTTECPLILLEGKEAEVREEDIVLVVNSSKKDHFLLAICRKGEGINENLKVGGYSPGVAYVRSKGEPPSKAKESYHFTLPFLGKLTSKGLETNDIIVSPGSRVYLFRRERSDHNPLDLIKPAEHVCGGYLVTSDGNWPIPFDKKFIPYHIGVFGATGSGKSMLARHLLIPLLTDAGYGVVVFDWEGVDYAPFFKEQSISIVNFKFDAFTIAEYIVRMADLFGYDNEEGPVPSSVIQVITRRIDNRRWWDSLDDINNGSELRSRLRQETINVLSNRPRWNDYGQLWMFKLDSGLARIPEDDWNLLFALSRGMSIDEFSLPTQGKICIIDLSEVSDELKLAFFSKLCSKLTSMMRAAYQKKLNLALIIDEAPQYCPFEPKGLQIKTTEYIKNLCALGRKRGLSIILLSQGMAGEIGINAAVRRNLNTLFIGQIHPLDLEEASKRLSPFGIRPEELLSLDPGKFYLTGKMNPSPIPLLISFKINQEKS